MTMNATRRILMLAALLLALMTQPAHAVTIEWVTVGNADNDPDPLTGNSYGAVDREYRIMKFEWTNDQYVAFLNAIDPEGLNPNLVYNNNMGNNARGGITNTGTTNGSRYDAKPGMGDKPVNYVSWWDAARVSNWLHNGALTYDVTDSSATAPQNTGAYTVGTGTSGTAVAKNTGALYWIPTESEWYKAAYYNPTLNSDTGGYTLYGNGFNSPAPTAVTANSTTGDGSAGLLSEDNSANFSNGAIWNGQTGNVTTVGTNGAASYYGAFDMSGNVFEWNDSGPAANFRDLRGGAYNTSLSTLTGSSLVISSPTTERSDRGFRLAAVPEPSTYAMALAGLACGGYLVRRSPRSSP
jgi:formylglycine-generating enzyme required for sulfatase activity